MLRSYAAAHGLNSKEHAVVEVSADSITLRVGSRWTRFTPIIIEQSDRRCSDFLLNEDGTVRIGNAAPEEMDMAAERIAREMLFGS